MVMRMLCLLGLFAIARSNDIENRLERLETTVEKLVNAVQLLSTSSVSSELSVEPDHVKYGVHHRALKASSNGKLCARLRNDNGKQAHGNHYLNTVWGAKTFGMQERRIYNCNDHVKFDIILISKIPN